MTEAKIGTASSEDRIHSAQIHYGPNPPNGGLIVDVDQKGDMFCRFSDSNGSFHIGNITEFTNIAIDDRGLKVTHKDINRQITPEIADQIRDRCIGPTS